jgi:catechol 2,3-dioxygenase-like lactoylglutathione lyase family enzyme
MEFYEKVQGDRFVVPPIFPRNTNIKAPAVGQGTCPLVPGRNKEQGKRIIWYICVWREFGMVREKLWRVGTIYIPVVDVEVSSEWYVNKLGAELSYRDEDKAILNFANQSFFLVKSPQSQSSNFIDIHGAERFSVTFEVNGLAALEALHQDLKENEVKVGEIENRGHSGRNFVFYDLDGNKFDVWSELSPIFKEKYLTN